MRAQPGNSGRMPPRSLLTLPASPASFLWCPKGASRPHPPFHAPRTPPYRIVLLSRTPALSPRKMETRILPNRSLRAHLHCARTKGIAPNAALSIDPTRSSPSRHLTGAF